MHTTTLLLELGGVLCGLALLARLAERIGIPNIPLYLLAGLAFGQGGLLPLITAQGFIRTGAELGLLLLLFMLGLEYSARELTTALRAAVRGGVLDAVLNFTPGLVCGLLLGWDFLAAVFLGGITYASSSGIVSKLLQDLGRTANRETPVVLSILVFEDLALAFFLALVTALLAGGLSPTGLGLAFGGVALVVIVLAFAARAEDRISEAVFSHSDEALLLTLMGGTLIVAGLAEAIRVSAAVGALLAGIVVSGPAAEGARPLLEPVRDLFAALFFVFFGLSIDPSTLPSSLGWAVALAAFTAVTKVVTGWMAAAWGGSRIPGRVRAGASLVPRGEFSIVVAGIAVAAGLQSGLGSLAAGYVLILAVAGPVVARFADPLGHRLSEMLASRAR
ncbi:MAG TPA: cation:proton antiporter [Actinomycetota bacterium]|jgi:CPA2 family monovalent cation:H+ antiporter-2|nr:cation:proton antiporter [Actinomycetota bacterium]